MGYPCCVVGQVPNHADVAQCGRCGRSLTADALKSGSRIRSQILDEGERCLNAYDWGERVSRGFDSHHRSKGEKGSRVAESQTSDPALIPNNTPDGRYTNIPCLLLGFSFKE